MADANAFSLEDCAEVCERCQHKATTAMTSYVRKALTRLSDAGGTDGGSEDGGGSVNALSVFQSLSQSLSVVPKAFCPLSII